MASCLPITSFSFGFRSNRGDWTLRLLKLALPHRNVEVGEVEKTNAPMSPERAAALASGRKEGRSGNLRARAVKFKCASRPYLCCSSQSHWPNSLFTNRIPLPPIGSGAWLLGSLKLVPADRTRLLRPASGAGGIKNVPCPVLTVCVTSPV